MSLENAMRKYGASPPYDRLDEVQEVHRATGGVEEGFRGSLHPQDAEGDAVPGMGATADICGEVRSTDSGEVWHRQPYYWATIGDDPVRRLGAATQPETSGTFSGHRAATHPPRDARHRDHHRQGSLHVFILPEVRRPGRQRPRSARTPAMQQLWCAMEPRRPGSEEHPGQGHAPADDAGRSPDLRGLNTSWVVEQTSVRPMKLVAVFLMGLSVSRHLHGSRLAQLDIIRGLFEPKDDLQ